MAGRLTAIRRRPPDEVAVWLPDADDSGVLVDQLAFLLEVEAKSGGGSAMCLPPVVTARSGDRVRYGLVVARSGAAASAALIGGSWSVIDRGETPECTADQVVRDAIQLADERLRTARW